MCSSYLLACKLSLKLLTSLAWMQICKNFETKAHIHESYTIRDWHIVSFLIQSCIQRHGDDTPFHSDVRPGCTNRLRSYALLWSWTVFAPRLVGYNYGLHPMNLGHILWSFSQDAIVQAELWSDLCIRCAVTHSHINGADPPIIRMLSKQSHPPLKLT